MGWKKWKKNPMLKAGLLGGALAGGTLLSGGTLPVAAGIGLAGAGLYQQYKNFDLQAKNNERQWDSYREQMAREDTSIGRRVQDLQSAGLSPVLAAGSGATSQAVFTGKAPQMENPLEAISGVLGLLQQKENITNTLMQRDLIESQIRKTDADSSIRWHDYLIYKKSGTASNSSGWTKDIQGLLGLLGSNPTLLKIQEELQRKASRYNESSIPGTWKDMFTTSGGVLMSPENKKQIKGGSK